MNDSSLLSHWAVVRRACRVETLCPVRGAGGLLYERAGAGPDRGRKRCRRGLGHQSGRGWQAAPVESKHSPVRAAGGGRGEAGEKERATGAANAALIQAVASKRMHPSGRAQPAVPQAVKQATMNPSNTTPTTNVVQYKGAVFKSDSPIWI